MNECNNIRERFPVLSDLDHEDIKFSNVPHSLRLEFAKIIDPDDHGWKIMAEKLGISPRDIRFIATLKKNIGSNTLNAFESYEARANSLHLFCQVMVECGYQDVLEELTIRWNEVLTIHRQSLRHPEEHTVCTYRDQCREVSCHYSKPHSSHYTHMDSMSPSSGRYQSDPTALGYRKCAEPCEHVSQSLPHVDASASEETRYTCDTHNRVQHWLQSNPHPSNLEGQSNQHPTNLEATKVMDTKVKVEGVKNNKITKDKVKSQKLKGREKTNVKNVIKLELMETSVGTDSSGHQSMETSGSSTDNQTSFMGVKSEKPDHQQRYGISTETQSLYFRQGQPRYPGQFGNQGNLPPFQVFSPSASSQPQPPMAQHHFLPNHNVVSPLAQPDYMLQTRLQHPNPCGKGQGSTEVHKPTQSPPIHGLHTKGAASSGVQAAGYGLGQNNYMYKPRSMEIGAPHHGASPDNLNPLLRTVPYGYVNDPMDTQNSTEHKNEKRPEKDRAQAIETGRNNHAVPKRTGSEPNVGYLSLRGPESQRCQDEPCTSHSGSFDSIKYSMSSEGRIESGPFVDSLRAASVFVTHLFACWGNFVKEKHYSKCALSLSRCLRENNFRIQMDVPKINSRSDKNGKENPWPDDSCWREWLDRKFASVNYILVCLSPAYLQVVNATHIEDTDDIQDNIMSTRYIFHLMQHEFEESRTGYRRFIPILFDDIPQNQIPSFLQNLKVYRWTKDFEDLLWRLNQPEQQVTNILANQQG